MIPIAPRDSVRAWPSMIKVGLCVGIRLFHDAADSWFICRVDLAHGVDKLLVPISELSFIFK